jgi:hypothetical protein
VNAAVMATILYEAALAKDSDAIHQSMRTACENKML